MLPDLKLDAERWHGVEALARSLVEDGTLPALAVQVVQGNRRLERPLMLGPQQPGGRSPLRDDAIFLVASITKPVVATAVMQLVERGAVCLNDRVVELLPEFDAAPRRPITVRHLLTHTSGLPDMLPNNRQLREANSPLSAFFDGTCAVTLDFPPGHGVQYQSMGFVLLAEIIRRVDGRTCSEFVQQEIFEPLGMRDSALGAPDGWFEGSEPRIDRVADVRVPPEQESGDGWNWNSRYWRQFGAPWGGMLSSVNDCALFCHAMLSPGRLLSRSGLRAATTNQLAVLPNVPEVDRRTRGWGLGWRLNWLSHSATFGDLLGSKVFGHWGATGTLCWIDPAHDRCCVILSTQPLDRGRNHLVRLSNAISAAFGS
jgi:CubicO group peptidase (beta-lactamase class C family)